MFSHVTTIAPLCDGALRPHPAVPLWGAAPTVQFKKESAAQ